MTKSIPLTLLATYQEPVTHKSNLLKIKDRNGNVLGLTNHSKSIAYNDGAGEIVYSAIIGMTDYAMESSAGLDVDNSEVMLLVAATDDFSAASIDAGNLDYGEYIVYRINRKDKSQGHEILDRGTIGIAKTIDGVSGVIELRSLQQLLKQTYGELDSLTCRARFGSGGSEGTCIARGQCGFPADTLWQNHSVDSVGDEVDRVFTANSAPSVNGPNGALSFAPGLVQWLTGNNAGLTSEIESVSGSEITLRFGTPYDIQASDTFKARPDCNKLWETCRDDYDNQNNFRGEPKIPITDEGSQATPNYSGAFGLGAGVDNSGELV